MKKSVSVLIAALSIVSLCIAPVYGDTAFTLVFIRNITEYLPSGTEVMLKYETAMPAGAETVHLYDDKGNQLEVANGSRQIWREITDKEQVVCAKALDSEGNVVATTNELVLPAGVTYSEGTVFYDFDFDRDGCKLTNDTEKTSSTGMYHSTIKNDGYEAVIYRTANTDQVTIEEASAAFAENDQGRFLKFAPEEKIQISQLAVSNAESGVVVMEMDVISKATAGNDTIAAPVGTVGGATRTLLSVTGAKSDKIYFNAPDSNNPKSVTVSKGWNHVVYIVDLDNEAITAVVNGTHLFSYTYDGGIDSLQRFTLNAVSGEMYMDNLRIAALPSMTVSRAEQGQVTVTKSEGFAPAEIKLYDITDGMNIPLGGGETVSVPAVAYDRKVKAAAFDAEGNRIACVSNTLTISADASADSMSVHYLAGEEPISATQAGAVTLKTVLTGDGTAKTQTLIGAVYSGDELISAQTKDVGLADGETLKTAELTFNNVTADMTIKAMLWDSMSGMQPICPVSALNPAPAP